MEYCPTDALIAKPLQGSLLRKSRAFLLNLRHSPTNAFVRDTTKAQECVETATAMAHGVHGIASGSLRQLSRDDVAPFDDISNVERKSIVVKGRRKPL